MKRLAFDIETVPLPVEWFSERQMRRYQKELARVERDRPEMDPEEQSRMARSLHPWLCWVCCVAAVTCQDERPFDGHVPYTGYDPYRAETWTAATPDDEADLLARFWAWLDVHAAGALVVGFNSKRFDAPVLRVRSLWHGLQIPTGAHRLLDTHRWRNEPHCDLLHVLDPHRVGLADACELLGVDTPKGDLDGGGVAAAIEAGQLDRVATYCAADARATLECYDVLRHLCPIS